MDSRVLALLFLAAIVSCALADKANHQEEEAQINVQNDVQWKLEKRLHELNEKNPDLYYGDVLLTTRQKIARYTPWARLAAIVKNNGRNRWPNNVVPYEYSGAHSSQERAVIEGAMREIQQKTCFRFVPKTSQHADYLHFDKKGGCYTYVGRIGGKQLVSLDSDCLIQLGTVMERPARHEIMHALGIEHEHQRPDRDSYIEVKYQNLASPSAKDQFEKLSYGDVDPKQWRYDLKSIMHYDSTAFAKQVNGKYLETIVPKQRGQRLVYNSKISAQDVQKLNFIGGCPNRSPGGGRQQRRRPPSNRGRGRGQRRQRHRG